MVTVDPVDLQQAEASRKFGRVVLMSILCFFMTFICVNVFFAYKALSTYTGVVDEHAYETGLHYNKIIAEAKKRKLESLNVPTPHDNSVQHNTTSHP